MSSSWLGIIACAVVIYFGVVHGTSGSMLLNPHALILVIGGTIAITLLTYPLSRLKSVWDYLIFGFLFRVRAQEKSFARDLLAHIDITYGRNPALEPSRKVHKFIVEALQYARSPNQGLEELQAMLLDRRNALKRKYTDDAKILANISKYPPNMGLLGAASGMIQMMSALGKSGVDTIGLAMATALTATLWGVGLNNFVFLPLSDNAMKAVEDEVYLRDIVIECCLLIKSGKPHRQVINTCLNRLTILDRADIAAEYLGKYNELDHAA